MSSPGAAPRSGWSHLHWRRRAGYFQCHRFISVGRPYLQGLCLSTLLQTELKVAGPLTLKQSCPDCGLFFIARQEIEKNLSKKLGGADGITFQLTKLGSDGFFCFWRHSSNRTSKFTWLLSLPNGCSRVLFDCSSRITAF